MSVVIAGETPDPGSIRVDAQSERLPVSRKLLLALVGVQLAFLYAPTVAWLVDRWTLSVWHNAHGMLIPFAVAYFGWQELRPLRHRELEANAWGFVFLLAGLAMLVLDAGMHTQIVSAASIVVVLPGLSLLFLGTVRTKAIIFPLLFLVFMLPIPLVVTERIHLFLRELATHATAALAPFVGINVYSEGTTLHLREGALEVGDACSGFSTLYASCAVAALTAYGAASWRCRLLALGSAVPLAIGANILRIVLLLLSVRYLGVESLDTWIHPASGMLTFMIALPAILWLGGSNRPLPRAEATS